MYMYSLKNNKMNTSLYPPPSLKHKTSAEPQEAPAPS